MLQIVKQLDFCCAHLLAGHEGACANVHGHNYTVLVMVTGDSVDACGRLVDFSVLKARFKGWLDANWDHTFIYNVEDRQSQNVAALLNSFQSKPCFGLPYNPTAENMVLWLVATFSQLIEDLPVTLSGLRVFETATSYAEWNR